MTIRKAEARETSRQAGAAAERDEHERSNSPSALEATADAVQQRSGLRRFLFENALTLVAFAFFVVSMAGLLFSGLRSYNEDQRQHREQPVSVGRYVTSGAFLEATGENWESAFLQMAIFVLLTRFLYQRGSSESKRIEEPEAVDQDPRDATVDSDTPWPVRRGGWWLKVYENSLSGATWLLFILSFALHAVGGAMKYNENQRQHGQPTVTVAGYVGTSQFWFESFQNWQSEFLSVGVLAVLTIWLRQQGSPQSKPVAAPSRDTG